MSSKHRQQDGQFGLRRWEARMNNKGKCDGPCEYFCFRKVAPANHSPWSHLAGKQPGILHVFQVVTLLSLARHYQACYQPSQLVIYSIYICAPCLSSIASVNHPFTEVCTTLSTEGPVCLLPYIACLSLALLHVSLIFYNRLWVYRAYHVFHKFKTIHS